MLRKEVMRMTATIEIDMDKKCVECGKSGPTPSGLCLPCISKAISGGKMKTYQGKLAKQRFDNLMKKNDETAPKRS